jgi:serine protease Do
MLKAFDAIWFKEEKNMDEQNKNNGYDDFFRKSGDGHDGRDNAKHEDGQSSARYKDGRDAGRTEETAKPSYYYSYGPFKPGAHNDEQGDQPYGTRSDKPKIIQDEPYGTTSSFASSASSAANAAPRHQDGQYRPVTSEEEASKPQPQLRAFTPSYGGSKGSWQANEPKKKKQGTSFGAMFMSFLAGVLVVGVLMYAADTQNWFTGAAATSSQEQSSGSNGQSAATGNAGLSTASARPDNIAQLFEQSSPAVVKIETYQSTSQSSGGGSSLFDDPFFRQFFGDSYRGNTQPDGNSNGQQGQMQQTGIGTGFFFESDGYILTNQHVIGNADQIKVIVQGYDEPFTAELLGSSYDLDLAVVKITGDKAFPTLSLGNSDNIEIGDWVVAIGNPYGFDHTVTVGVLSAKERPIDIQDTEGERNYEHLLQTDASINPGNSGGPLLNVNGEVVGINTAVSSQAQGIGFAIPTSTIKNVLDDLKTNTKPAAPFIGAELQDVTEQIAAQLGMEKVEGVIVRAVTYNSPAYNGGLQQYDVITGIDGKKYNSTQDLIKVIQGKAVGDKIELNVIRKGANVNVSVEIGDKNKFGVQ